jgi:glycosyltransferase involved in cell wall biosynthesis
MRRALFVVTEDWYFVSHRLHLAEAARHAGYEVAVLTRVAAHGAQIEAAGVQLIPWSIERRSANPAAELASLLQLWRTIRALRPTVVHAVALKPVLYAGLLSFANGRHGCVYALGGLGNLFGAGGPRARGWLRALVVRLFAAIFSQSRARVILQNEDDAGVLMSAGALAPAHLRLVRGAGVDTEKFRPAPEPDGPPLVVLPARMLWDKGVGEFVQAARALRERGCSARFALVGDRDPHNPACVPAEQLAAWQRDGVVEYWGRREDMPAVLQQAAVVCLPSTYKEGLPKSLLEAASCARPIVTYDLPGCCEAVEHERNGLLVPPRDQPALEAALLRLLADPDLRRAYGEHGRALVLREFAQERIAAETLAVWSEVGA